MCMTIDFMSGGTGFELGSVYDLCSHELWPNALDLHAPYGRTMNGITVPPHSVEPDECLCAVDVEAILDRAGLEWKNDHISYTVETTTPPVEGGPKWTAVMDMLQGMENGTLLSFLWSGDVNFGDDRLASKLPARLALDYGWVEHPGAGSSVKLTEHGQLWLRHHLGETEDEDA